MGQEDYLILVMWGGGVGGLFGRGLSAFPVVLVELTVQRDKLIYFLKIRPQKAFHNLLTKE